MYQLHPPLTDVIYKEIKQGIYMGEFLPGQKLIVEELQKKYGVSNTPIKEALNRLVTDNLVDAVARRGMFVHNYSFQEIKNHFEYRQMIEFHCMEQILSNFKKNTDARIAFISNLRRSKELVDQHYDYATHCQLDMEFHELYIGLHENQCIIQSYEKMSAISFCFRTFYQNKQPLLHRAETQSEHEEIYQSLVSGDKARLHQALQIHLDHAMDSLLPLDDQRTGKDSSIECAQCVNT